MRRGNRLREFETDRSIPSQRIWYLAAIFAVLRWRGRFTTAFIMLIPVFSALVVGGIVWLAHLTDRRG